MFCRNRNLIHWQPIKSRNHELRAHTRMGNTCRKVQAHRNTSPFCVLTVLWFRDCPRPRFYDPLSLGLCNQNTCYDICATRVTISATHVLRFPRNTSYEFCGTRVTITVWNLAFIMMVVSVSRVCMRNMLWFPPNMCYENTCSEHTGYDYWSWLSDCAIHQFANSNTKYGCYENTCSEHTGYDYLSRLSDCVIH